MTDADYEIVGHLPNGAQKLRFTSNEFKGIIFTIGKVSFENANTDEMVMQYQYDVLEHTESYEKTALDKAVGDLVIYLLGKGVQDNSLVYTGGLDAN